jgi:dTDP-4-dehydrorhamnose 3,5-epimerase
VNPDEGVSVGAAIQGAILAGEVYDVVLDLRAGSPTAGRWQGFWLRGGTHRQLWIPRGLAHGFCVTSDTADVLYACDAPYRPGDEGGVAWDDPALGIDWPVRDPLLSDKDRAWPRLADQTLTFPS